jgi:hypothetical protein
MLHFICRLLPLWLILSLGASPASAASTLPAPIVRPYVFDAITGGLIDQQLFVVPAAPMRPLAFGATITREVGSLPVDIYLGVISPKGEVYSWIPKQGGGGILVKGLSPVARSVNETTFATSTVFGTDPKYTFSEGDVPGMYSVFALLVPPGSDPNDARRWTWVNMVPLLFQGLTIQ